MTNIQVPTRDQVNEKAQGIFDNLKAGLGMVPNLYATIGYSADTLGNFLGFSQGNSSASLTKKEIEAIKLSVSQINNCQYCLAAHTALGKMAGFSEDETIEIRSGEIADSKLKALSDFAKETTLARGKADARFTENLFNAGYTNENLIDALAVIAEITFTNYVHGTTKVPIDFPVTKKLV